MQRERKKKTALSMGSAMRASEHQEQVALMQWWRAQCAAWGIDENLLFAIPNGGNRSAVTGRMLKSEGVRKGIPDLFLAVCRGKSAGLFIELKTLDGRVTKEQARMLELLAEQGYCTAVARGFDSAKKIITEYIGER